VKFIARIGGISYISGRPSKSRACLVIETAFRVDSVEDLVPANAGPDQKRAAPLWHKENTLARLLHLDVGQSRGKPLTPAIAPLIGKL